MGATTYAANLSFHSRFEPPGDPVRRFRERGRRPISTDGPAEKIYLSAVVSDGDSLNFVLRRVFGGMWLHEDRGTVPIGWELSPLLERFGPGILDYLQATATENDDFLSGPSGLGYFYPGDMAEDVLRHTLRRTRDAVEALGLTETTVMHPRTHRTRGIYNEELGDVLDGAVDGYVGKEAETAPIVFGSGFVWTPAALPITHRLANDANDLKRPLEWLAAATDVRPLFVPIHVPAHKLTMMDVVELDRQLDDEAFEFLPPNQFFAWAASAGADRLVDAAGFG